MATRKQRRRRQKDRRHEYEYVYIDEEGNEIEVEESTPSRKDSERKSAASKNGRPATGGARGRPRAGARPVQPPTWRYMRKQALIFVVILFAAFSIFNNGPIWASALLALIYTALMMPLMWMMQRMLYRSYLKRTGQLPPPRERKRK